MEATEDLGEGDMGATEDLEEGDMEVTADMGVTGGEGDMAAMVGMDGEDKTNNGAEDVICNRNV